MIWSKSKKALESLLAESVKDHARFHITRYGPGVSAIMTRAWITWDGEEIVHMSTIEQITKPSDADTFSRWDFTDAVEDYLSLSIDDALGSENTIVRALTMFDRRLGKRRLKALQLRDSDDPLVIQFYNLRLHAEGLAEAVTE